MLLAATLAMAAGLLPPAGGGAGEASWLPRPARGQGERCVADTDWMRRNHMTALSHQRDETVHDGLRGQRFSLRGCLECHAVKGADGRPVTAASPDHFCRTCHDFAAVRMDCFDCHASRPEAGVTSGGKAALGGSDEAQEASLVRYLRSRRQ
jgi:predicted CXXCH cytochrome family protein